jgi:DHA1 family inner membrane transport protein
MLSLLLFGLTAHTLVGLFVSMFLIGASVSAASPTIQARLMDVAHDSQSIAAALNHSALNIGNSLGAFLGGLVIAGGLGYIAPAYVGVSLSIVGLAILMVSLALDRRTLRRA